MDHFKKNKQAKGIINGLTNCCCHGKQIGRAINNESNSNLMVLFYRINIFGKRVIGKHGGTECWIMSPQDLTKCRL